VEEDVSERLSSFALASDQFVSCTPPAITNPYMPRSLLSPCILGNDVPGGHGLVTKSISRRNFLIGLAGIPAAGLSLVGSPTVMAVDDRQLGPRQPFDFERLRTVAREMAMKPYDETPIHDAELLHSIDFDAHQKIRFRSERSSWADGNGP
jgi:hypothetical protein